MEHSKYGRASCVVFALVVACVVCATVLYATMPPPTGGGEFRGINNLARGMGIVALILGGMALSFVGCVLGMAGLMQKGEQNSNAATAGLSLNFLSGGALVLWWLFQ
jgi:hypothetical protein